MDEKLDSHTEIVSKNVPNANLEPVLIPHMQSSSWAQVAGKTIEDSDYDEKTEKTIVIYNISESDDIIASQSTECIFEKEKHRTISMFLPTAWGNIRYGKICSSKTCRK